MDSFLGRMRQELAYNLTFGLEASVRELWEMVRRAGLQYPPSIVTVWEVSGAETLFRDRSELWKVSWRRELKKTFDSVLDNNAIHCFISDRALAVLFNNHDWGPGDDSSPLPELKRRIENLLALKFVVGVGRVYPDARQLGMSFHEARQTAERVRIVGGQDIGFFDAMSEGDDEPLLETEKLALKRAIQKNDRRETALVIQKIKEMLSDRLDNANLSGAKTVIFELLSVVSIASLESGRTLEELFPYFLEWITKLRLAKEVSDLHEMIASAGEKVLVLRNHDRSLEARMITRAKEFLENHLGEDLTLSDIAKRQFLSPCYFSRLFKQSTGQTVMEFLTALRMAKGKELLEKTNQPVSQVAGTVGYSDPNYFSRVFKRHFGMAPSEYRAKY
ncbi:Homeodomain-like [Acididesulfobacillus acetoxydans]|uniref:Homeodomain-like n=1 Tax=Acididesulfobacillus acetoxydans TaxID=1561005 RepID=A0A8S0XVC5_9FIRM|nr:helix-turn-helix domain-containing protein [Acididesulfobacillus acetoxydans]CAA7600217.1 Homeodomain-like [Acididesulfobacillus acetoxydans]CEJ09595.1 Two component AraC transcriptional regulator [Acididesulfobacillus acetoxydans]